MLYNHQCSIRLRNCRVFKISVYCQASVWCWPSFELLYRRVRLTDQGLRSVKNVFVFWNYRWKKIISPLDSGGPRPQVCRGALLRASFWRQPDPGLGAVTREVSRPCQQWRRKQLLGVELELPEWGVVRAVRHRKEYSPGERMVYGYTYSPGPGDKAREAQQVTGFFVY